MKFGRRKQLCASEALAGALLGLLVACGGDGAEVDVSPPVPALPDYVEGFDPRVAQLVRSSHAELREDPGDAPRWMKLGKVYEAHSESSLALPCYRGALELEQGRARWWYRLAMALGGSDRIEEALEALERSITLDMTHGPAHWRRGLWLLEMDRSEEARQAFQRSLELDADDPAGHLGLVQVHLHSREYARAVTALEGHAILSGPNGPFARKLLGTAYQRLGQEEKARLLLASARNARPSYSDDWNRELDEFRRGMAAINRQARTLIAGGRVLAAITLLEPARLEEPEHVPILRTLGAAYAAVGRTKDAYDVLVQAAGLEPENIELHIDATWARAMFGQLAEALADVDRILEQDETNNKAHALRTQLLLDLGRGPEAVEAFAAAMRHGARKPRMLVDIGKTQLELGEPADARASFGLAAEQDPMQQDAWIGQAIACLELEDSAGAEAALQRAEELVTFQGHGDAGVLRSIRAQIEQVKSASRQQNEDGGG